MSHQQTVHDARRSVDAGANDRALSVRRIATCRRGFTLIELITAMLSATIVVVSLASAIVVSTQMLESPPDDQAMWDQREIIDRLAGDLRYANSISEDQGFGFDITKPNALTGAAESVNYELYIEGMKRRVGSGPIMKLNTVAPSHSDYVDGYSAPTAIMSFDDVRVRATSSAASLASSSSLDISVPPGSKPGDFMLLCVAAKTPDYFSVSTSGWETMHEVGINDLRLIVLKHTYSASWSPTTTISVNVDSGIAATMLAIENTNPYDGVEWSASRGSYAWSFYAWSHPTPYETSGFGNHQLNVQVFAVDNDPWNNGTFGMAGFTGVGQVTAASGDSDHETTVGVLVRSGASPTLNDAPHLLQLSSGYWAQVGIRLGVTP